MGSVGNPSSLHGAGRAARRVVEESREMLAAATGARPSDVVWTSGGTEANNLVIKGITWARAQEDYARKRIIVSAIEHQSVLDPTYWLAEHGGNEVVLIPVDSRGQLDLDALSEAIADCPASVALVSVMAANNETGTLAPIKEVVSIAHRHGIPVHCDAVQALGQVPLDFAEWGVDALSITAHKVGGPVGTGALLARRETKLVPVMHGGGQERSVRSGTIDAVGVAGFAHAAAAVTADVPAYQQQLAALRHKLVAACHLAAPDCQVVGPDVESQRLPGIVSAYFPGCGGEVLTMVLDAAGIATSTGSACHAGVAQASHVLLALGMGEEEAKQVVRFSLGHTSANEDIAELARVLPEAVARSRKAST